MRARHSLSVLLPLVTLLVGGVAGCGSPADGADAVDEAQPVPTFSASEKPGPGGLARPRQTLLPTDCAEALGGASMSALLGQPVDSVEARAVLGQAAPSVGRLERVTCLYQRVSNRRGAPGLEMNLAAYTTAAATDAQLNTNAAAEKAEARTTEEFSIGTARAALFAERGQSVLMVASGRSSVTILLRDGLVDPRMTRQVMVDLAQRVLPNLVPEDAESPRLPSAADGRAPQASSGEPG